MLDTTSDPQPAPRAETVTFAIFSAANSAAVHLLDLIQSKSSPATLKCYQDKIGDKIGYHLSIASSPSNADFKRTWRIGAGPTEAIRNGNFEHTKPDILLCPPDGISAATARRFFRHLHATIYFHEKTRALMFEVISTRSITYLKGGVDGKDLELARDKTPACVLRQIHNYLRFGDYLFDLELVVQGQGKTKTEPTDYPVLHSLSGFNHTPMEDPKSSRDIWLLTNKPHSSITSGVNIFTGELVAVKELDTSTISLPYSIDRLRIARQYYKKRDQGVLGIIDVWCERQCSPSCLSDRRVCEKLYYSMPLAENSFRDMKWNKIDKARLALFYQTLLGLSKLHEKNITHGSILPESLLFLTETDFKPEDQPLTITAVISLNIRERKKKPDASICIAPEVWDRMKDGGDLDEAKFDIWALAASWLYTLIEPPEDLKINPRSHRMLQTILDECTKKEHIQEPLTKLLRRMLAWEPQDRPSAADALEDEVWKPIHDEIQEELERRKRKKREMTEGGGGKKRVRVVSPELDE
ncbi:kinase-like domain-containing protein [Trichoderma sp. SZMC 28013]